MKNIRIKAPAVACAALATIAGFGVVPGPANAASPPQVTQAADMDSALGVRAYMATEDQLERLSDQQLATTSDAIDRASDDLGLDKDGVYPDGFSGMVVNPATGSLDIWWKGGQEAAFKTAAFRTGDSTALSTLKVTVHEGAYDRNAELKAIAENRQKMVGADLVFPKEDGSGIVITHAPGSKVDGTAIAEMTGFPVTVVEDTDAAADLTGGRQADVSPHTGGAMMVHGNRICSTGFSVLSGANGRLLSAAHCDTTGNLAWNNGAGTQLTVGGSSVSVALSVDSMFIDPVGGTQGYIYTGGVNSNTRAAVSGSAANNVGDVVATGGANSGAHRGATVIKDAYAGNCNGYSCTLIVAESPNGTTLGVEGDSGGPVYHTNADGRVTAKGIILQGAQQLAQSSCGTEAYPGNACFKRVRYQPIRPLMTVWGVSLETHA